jgi:hypothetical protein
MVALKLDVQLLHKKDTSFSANSPRHRPNP